MSSTPAESVASTEIPILSVDEFRAPSSPNTDLRRLNGKLYRRCYVERKKRPRTGWYWQHGTEWEEVDDRDKSILYWACKHCRRFHIYHHKGSVNITHHLLTEHGIREASLSVASAPSVHQLMTSPSLSPGPMSKADAKEWKRRKAHEALVDWVAYDHITFRQVESSRFKRFCQSISDDSADLVPTAHSTVRTWVMNEFATRKRQMIDYLATSRSVIHFSFDLWTSPYKHMAVLGTVAHFLRPDYTNDSILLSLRRLQGTHSGENMADIILETQHEFEITELGYYVTDNHPANDLAVGKILSENAIPEKVEQRRLRCLGHIVNLAAKAFLFGKDTEAFEAEDYEELAAAYKLWQIAGPVGQVHFIFTFIRASSERREDFLKLQDDRRALMALDNNQTRWNSTFTMLRRAKRLRKAIDLFCLQYIDSKDLEETVRISDDTWSLIGKICDILEHFEYATLALEGAATDGHHGALWECLPMLEELLLKVEELKKEYPLREELPTNVPPPPPTRRARLSQTAPPLPPSSIDPPLSNTFIAVGLNNAWQKLNKYYTLTDKSTVYVLAVVLNPQYKWKYFEKMWASKPDWIESAKENVQKHWDYYRDTHPLKPEEPSIPVLLPSSPRPQHVAKRVQAALESDSDSEVITDEYEYYCEKEKRVKMIDGLQFKPIGWWADLERQRRYRTLSRLAFDLLSVPAMSAEVERVFSSTRRLVTDGRNQLDIETIEANECLRNWPLPPRLARLSSPLRNVAQ